VKVRMRGGGVVGDEREARERKRGERKSRESK